MSNDAKKISSLAIATTLSANDRVVVLANAAGSPSVKTITVGNLTSSIRYANTTAAGVIKVGNNLSVNSTGFLNSNTNTGTITFSDNIISTSNTNELIFINNPNNGIQIGGQWLTQMSATSNASNLWGGGNTEAYAWVYQDNGEDENGYAEFGAYLESGNSGQNIIDFYVTTDPERVLYLRAQYPSASPAIDTTLRYTAEGILYLPNTVGDIYRDGISVLGTGQIDGGNAFTTPTAEITVDGGGA